MPLATQCRRQVKSKIKIYRLIDEQGYFTLSISMPVATLVCGRGCAGGCVCLCGVLTAPWSHSLVRMYDCFCFGSRKLFELILGMAGTSEPMSMSRRSPSHSTKINIFIVQVEFMMSMFMLNTFLKLTLICSCHEAENVDVAQCPESQCDPSRPHGGPSPLLEN